MNPVTALSREAYRRYTQRETKTHQLRYLFLEITRSCNLSCIHCGSDCSAESGSELTTDSWIKIIAYLKQNISPLPFIVLTGGEPLVHRDLYKITEALNREGFSWGMVTNGTLLTKDTLNILIAHSINSITLSYDGDESSISYIRNSPNAYERIRQAAELIGQSPIPQKDGVACIYPGNLKQLDSIAKTLAGDSFNSLRLFSIFPKGRAEHNTSLCLSQNQIDEMLNWICQNRRAYEEQGFNLSFSCEGYLPYSLDRQVRDEPFFCRSGINFASILSNGYITGCNNNGPEYYQGHILKNDFLHIWEKGFSDYRNREWMKTGPCADCKEWIYCRGGSIHLRDKKNDSPGRCCFAGIGEIT